LVAFESESAMSSDNRTPHIEEAPQRKSLLTTTNVVLLGQTKQFLEAQLRKQMPDTILVQAWEEFYRVYGNLIRRFVLTQGLRGADADDCVQEVWSTVAQKLGEFERSPERPGLRAWLYAVVRSRTADYLRRNLRRPAEPLDAALARGAEPVSLEPDPAATFDREWQQALLRTALEELRRHVSERSYRTLEMRLFEGRSEAETAEALGLTIEQVRYRKHRMQQKLRALVAVYSGQDFG
jgi:RNA polymerase sigma-70 factor, ECF subfamily